MLISCRWALAAPVAEHNQPRSFVSSLQCTAALQELEEDLAGMRQELAAAREVAARASGTWDKFRKERDFHRMHHKRVAQEKNQLITDIKRLKVSCVLYLQHHAFLSMKQQH